MTPADHQILVALSQGAVLRDMYRAGKSWHRAPVASRTLITALTKNAKSGTVKHGTVKHVTGPAIVRLEAAGMIATPGSWRDDPYTSHDVVWKLTAAGLAASGYAGAEPVETYEPVAPPPVDPDCPF